MKKWAEDSYFDTGTKLIDTRFCTEKDMNDINNSNDDSNFYKLTENNEYDVKKFTHRMKCIDNPERDLKLWGHYSTS